MKLGKKPAVADDRDLKLERYLKTSVLPKPPAEFGHEKAFPVNGWSMLGNDTVGDCVFASACHQHMLWNAAAGKHVSFTAKNALSDYSAVTGYDPKDPSTDQGTDMRTALKYRVKTGIIDSTGKRHRIRAFVAVDPKDWATMMTALYLFEVVEVGIQFPQSASQQFNAGKPWSVVKGSPIEGGHDIPLVARRGETELVTWGKRISATKGFLEAYIDEAFVPLTDEMLVKGKSLEGFDTTALLADLKAVAG